MHYLVLDLEWNIADRNNKKQLENIVNFSMEIIEIGAVLLDENLSILDRFYTYVKPQYFVHLDHHVSKVTQRNTASLKKGMHFREAIGALQAWIRSYTDGEIILCTWSKSDVKPWRSNLEHYDLLPTKASKILDVQRLFALEDKSFSQQKSVAFALDYYNIAAEEPFHSAINDAYYTAMILQNLVSSLQGKELLPKTAKRLSKRLSRLSFDPSINRRKTVHFENYTSKEEAIQIVKKSTWSCPACNRELEGNGRWKSKKALRLHRKQYCRVHGIVSLNASVYRDRKISEQLWQVSVKVQIELPL